MRSRPLDSGLFRGSPLKDVSSNNSAVDPAVKDVDSTTCISLKNPNAGHPSRKSSVEDVIPKAAEIDLTTKLSTSNASPRSRQQDLGDSSNSADQHNLSLSEQSKAPQVLSQPLVDLPRQQSEGGTEQATNLPVSPVIVDRLDFKSDNNNADNGKVKLVLNIRYISNTELETPNNFCPSRFSQVQNANLYRKRV